MGAKGSKSKSNSSSTPTTTSTTTGSNSTVTTATELPPDADLDTLIKDANAKLAAGSEQIQKLLGKNIPIVVDWDQIRVKMATTGNQEETKEVVKWLSVNALTLVLSTEGGLGELVVDPFSRDIILKYVNKVELQFQPEESNSEKFLGTLGIYVDPHKQFHVELIPEGEQSVTVAPPPVQPEREQQFTSLPQKAGTLVISFGPLARRKVVQTLAKVVGSIFNIKPLKILTEANKRVDDVEAQLKAVIGKRIDVEIDLVRALMPVPKSSDPKAPKYEHLTDEQKERVTKFLTGPALDHFLSEQYGFPKMVATDPKNIPTILKERLNRIVFTYDLLEENFIKETLSVVNFAYEFLKDRRFRCIFNEGQLTLFYGHDYSLTDAKNLHLHLAQALDFKTHLIIHQNRANAVAASETLEKQTGKKVEITVVEDIQNEESPEEQRAILSWIGKEGLNLITSEDYGFGHVFKNPTGVEVFKEKINTIKIDFKIVRGFLEDPVQMLSPFSTYSSDAYLRVDLDSNGLMTIAFGSRLTVQYSKNIWRHLIRVLGLEREELIRDIAAYQEELRKILNDPEIIVKVDFENLDKDPSKNLDKRKMAGWLVDTGLKSLISPQKGLQNLTENQKADMKERVDIVLLTYDLADDRTNVTIAPRIVDGVEKHVMVIKYGFQRDVTNQMKNSTAHISKVLEKKEPTTA